MLNKIKERKLQNMLSIYEKINLKKVSYETEEKEIKEKIEAFIRNEKIENIQMLSTKGQKFSLSIITGEKECIESEKIKNNFVLNILCKIFKCFKIQKMDFFRIVKLVNGDKS